MLNFYAASGLIISPSRQAVYIGDRASIYCHSNLDVTFSKIGNKFLHKNQHQIGNVLVLVNVDAGNSGHYICRIPTTNKFSDGTSELLVGGIVDNPSVLFTL